MGQSRAAHASGYLLTRFGSDYGTPARGNPYAVYFNPAAMGATEGTQLTLEVSPLYRRATYTRTADALGDRNLANPANTSAEAVRYRYANTGTATLSNPLALGYFGVTTDLGLKTPLRIGYAAYIPLGGAQTWDKRTDAIANDPLAPGARDGVQRWHNITGTILAVYNTLAASYTLEDARLSFGANVSLVYHDVDTVRARDAVTSNDAVQTSSGQFAEGRTRLTAHGINFAAALGIYWEPLPDRSLRIGASYTSSPGFGEMRLDGELTVQDASNPNVAQPAKAQLLQTYPDVVRIGGAYRVSQKVDIRADAEYVRWSVFNKQCVVTVGQNCNIASNGSSTDGPIVNIPRASDDTISMRGGLGYFVTEAVEIFGSASFSSSAFPKRSIDASALDGFAVYGTVGGRFLLSEHFALGTSANVIHFLPIDTQGQSRTDQLQLPSTSPSANGRYTQDVYVLNVNGTVMF